MTTRQKYWLHFTTAKQPTTQVRVQVEAQTARNFGLKRILLSTVDAHEVYAKVGFTPLPDPTKLMILTDGA